MNNYVLMSKEGYYATLDLNELAVDKDSYQMGVCEHLADATLFQKSLFGISAQKKEAISHAINKCGFIELPAYEEITVKIGIKK